MIKTSKQLKDLVGNRAHGDSAKSMLFLRNYAMERFLERLSASKYRNCFMQNEAWMDEEKRIVSFHEIPGSRYYSAEEHDFWQVIVSLILAGYRVQ